MKALISSFVLCLFIFTSCITINEGDPKTDSSEMDIAYEQSSVENVNIPKEVKGNDLSEGESFSARLNQKPLKTHEFRDARTGLVVSSTEYPASWTVISKPTYTIDQKIPVFLIQTSGPNNLKSFNTPFRFYISYQNPQTYQFMHHSSVASMHRPMVSNQQLMQEEVTPRMEKSGFRFIKNIRLSKTENYLQQKLRNESGGQIQMDILATVWENNEGQKALATVGKLYMQQSLSFMDTMTMWMYSTDYTFVDAEHLDETITAFEDALLSSKENPQWKQYMAQLSQQRAQKAARDHQIRMRDRNAAFAAHQKKMQGIWAAQDANHASFMNRNFGPGSGATQQNFVNMINEEETVYNPLNGQNYQVNAFSNQTWMDSDGNTIQNNDLFYTPNGDINLNNREWVQVGNQN